MGALALTSCSDFTELEPKGMNLLSSTTELELLLNREYYSSANDMRTMCGDIIYSFSYVSTDLAQPNKTRGVIMWTWDEASIDKMAELTSSDDDYETCYNTIGTVCNPILSRIDEATGDEQTKRQLKAEALAQRAYFHFLAVNKFAKAYNPSTASTTLGIIYLTDDIDIAVPQEQKTVAEVYELILRDINAAIDLNALPKVAVSHMRMNEAAAYAVKALVLQNMQQYDEAEAAAKQSIASSGTIIDLNSDEYAGVTNGFFLGGSYPCISKPQGGTDEDLFYIYYMESFNSFNPAVWDNMEPGHAIHDRLGNVAMIYDYMMGGEGMTGIPWSMSYDGSSGWNIMGIRTPQMHLVVAEAELHKGNVDEAMKYVDMVREKRISPEVYQPLRGTVTSQSEAKEKYLQTAVAENLISCYNFINYKRWNQISGWEKTYTRDFGLGTTYTLSPHSPMWVFPFPQNVMTNNNNISQNY